MEKSYSSAWGKWLLWCSRTNTNPFPSSIGPVLDFLTEQFQEGKQYTTLNSYQSALSATLHHIDGRPVGQHPIVCHLLQGIFNERPPAPRYQQVWDVSLVVRYFQAGQPTSELTLKELSKKLVTVQVELLTSELWMLDLDNPLERVSSLSYQVWQNTSIRATKKIFLQGIWWGRFPVPSENFGYICRKDSPTSSKQLPTHCFL